MTKPRGVYIVIEGPDGTGKTTQADIIQKALQKRGITAIHIKEPGGSPVNEAIRTVILDASLARTSMTNLLLFTANRHELWHDIIQPTLATGTWVIATRNYWSSLAYQGYGESMDQTVITETTRMFTSAEYMSPDVGIILTLNNSVERSKRVSQRGVLDSPDIFESKNIDFQLKIENGYMRVAKEYSLPTIDATQPIKNVAEDVWRYITPLLTK